MAINTGNAIASARARGVKHTPPGYEFREYLGTAVIDANASTSWRLFDQNDNPAVIGASASRPIYIVDLAFTIPQVMLGTAGDRLKLATSLADAAGYVATSNPVDSNGFMAAQPVLAGIAPYQAFPLTNAVEFKLFLHNGNATPAGSLIPAATSPIVVTTPAPVKTKPVRIPARIGWLVRMDAPDFSDDIDISSFQDRIDKGLPFF